MTKNAYRHDRREMSFYLNEIAKLDSVLANAPYDGLTSVDIEMLVDRAEEFSRHLGAAYMQADREEARLEDGGKVRLPTVFTDLWRRYVTYWRETHGTVIPYEAQQVNMEILSGANPAFITYGGFNIPAIRLISEHGTPRQKEALLPKLKTLDWDACFCVTEPKAGSDVSMVTSCATPDGSGLHLVTGEKIFISAGMHEMTDNTVYIVLARSNARSAGTYQMTCLLVPKYWPEEDGTFTPNNVTCAKIEKKMGLKACANAHLLFGAEGPTRAFALGDRVNIGLLQLQSVMQEARMGTGLFALGMASSAYLHALDFARKRVQGRSFMRSFDMKAPHCHIIEHPDVQRMLLEMQGLVEGSRGLIGKLTGNLSAAASARAAGDTELAARHAQMAQLYTPIVKAYVSDQAWRVAELSMQVHGGVGYCADLPIEQYARDIRILSIWEGTNYIQAQDLVRDKLGFGRKSRNLAYFVEDYNAFLLEGDDEPSLAREFAACATALEAIVRTMEYIASVSAGDTPEAIGQYCTRILHMFGTSVVAQVLLRAAVIAGKRLKEPDLSSGDVTFYEGKIASARFFVHNLLPAVVRDSSVILDNSSFITMHHGIVAPTHAADEAGVYAL
ncbi:acyl-CoA dehydrogenase [Nguyenibacter vanlangensis]|uniref:Acyl-CoA dehydrogenase n=1 Tax=Nguyenibacter vanlangensis TaxID=1216886 RepID=A0A7Y7IT01_9PROT|nr:acyl-CoA dehydrogenase [Nguyenibacter vanlangensis]NVN09771.1 acyl-CoA dehydrogenase [Nguyenibacter vanlangensis]